MTIKVRNYALVKETAKIEVGVNIILHTIDCDADPQLPHEGYIVEEHRKGGQVVWDPTKFGLYLSPNQKEGKTIDVCDLYKELEFRRVLNANVLDYLIENPTLIPKELEYSKKKQLQSIFFWGTVYSLYGKLYVRCMYRDWDGRWRASIHGFDRCMGEDNPAAVPV